MSRRAYLVVGPESAGNRIVAALLARAGCTGEGSTFGRYQSELPDGESPVVLIRSLPHGEVWPSLESLVVGLRERGYSTTVVVVSREPTALARSQVARGLAVDERSALQVAHLAYADAVASCSGLVEWYLVSVEALALSREAVAAFLNLLGLPGVTEGELLWEGRVQDGSVRDENLKHYAVVGARS